jgi:hypothetical protein
MTREVFTKQAGHCPFSSESLVPRALIRKKEIPVFVLGLVPCCAQVPTPIRDRNNCGPCSRAPCAARVGFRGASCSEHNWLGGHSLKFDSMPQGEAKLSPRCKSELLPVQGHRKSSQKAFGGEARLLPTICIQTFMAQLSK